MENFAARTNGNLDDLGHLTANLESDTDRTLLLTKALDEIDGGIAIAQTEQIKIDESLEEERLLCLGLVVSKIQDENAGGNNLN